MSIGLQKSGCVISDAVETLTLVVLNVDCEQMDGSRNACRVTPMLTASCKGRRGKDLRVFSPEVMDVM